MTNLNELAKRITLSEGHKVNLSIAQCKEVIKLTLSELKQLSLEDLMALLKRVK